MADVSVLDVLLHGEAIGHLTHVQGDRTLFTFREDYIADEARATLSLAFKDEFGGLITGLPPVQSKLPAFFSNLLPEGPLRDYLAERADVNPRREFFLLQALGRDLPGAVTIRPGDGEDAAQLPEAGVEAGDSKDALRSNALRFSLAGVQLKFSARKSAEMNGGLTIPARGIGGSWIVKLPSLRFEGVPENEFAIMSLARLVGITAPEFTLMDLDQIGGLPEGLGTLKGRAYAIQRFDRTAEGAVHMEDFAQVFGVYPDDKYERASYRNIASVVASEAGEEGVAEFIRRLVFCALTGNADMHLKNWSLIYYDRRSASLAPAYDFMSTVPYMPGDEAALVFARSNRFADFTLDELSTLASRAGLAVKPVVAVARETVARFHEAWAAEKNHLPQMGDVTRAIDIHLKTLPMATI